MMNDKILRIMVVLIAGWLLGYIHHHFAVGPELTDLKEQVRLLETSVAKARSDSENPTKVSVKTTAYSNDRHSINVKRWHDSRTATNKPVKRGLVAADWRVFPPGTRLYIPGYGEATVEDKGGAIKGMHLDLFVDSRQEALEWGVKELDVYVIERGI